MEPITLEIDDVKVTLKTIRRKKEYKCDCKDYSAVCTLRQHLSIGPASGVFRATEVLFNVRNTSSESWPVRVTNWELVDTDGYAYKARALCDSLRPPTTLDLSRMSRLADSPRVTQGTQADFVLVFPDLEGEKEISFILHSEGEKLQAFEIKELKPDAVDLMRAREAIREETQGHEPNIRQFRYDFERLRKKINSRLNSTLPRDTGVELEEEIRQSIEEIRQKLKFEDERTRNAVEEMLSQVISDYESNLEPVKAQEEERKKLVQEIEALAKMHPREFEEWVGDLLKNLGYEKVTLTPASNDDGVDVLAEYKGLKVAIQCKEDG